MNLPNVNGIYIHGLLNEEPISIENKDKRRKNKVPYLNKEYHKFGIASKGLSKRAKNYIHTFGKENIFNYFYVELPELSKEELQEIETMIKEKLDHLRVINPHSNRKLEWLHGNDYEYTKRVILEEIEIFKETFSKNVI